MTRIKICGITREEDAFAAADGGADALGLVFFQQSPRHITVGRAARLVKKLPPFITLVGLFVNPGPDYVNAVLEEVPLDVLQFHGGETPTFCMRFARPYIKAIRMKEGVDLVQCAARYSGAQALLLDAWVEGVPGGTGKTFDWEAIPHDLDLPVILSGGLTPDNVAEAVRIVRPYAVDVSSGVEVDKGIKDADKIAAFIREVEQVDLQLSR